MAITTLFAKQVWVSGVREAEASVPRNIVAAEILFDRSAVTGQETPEAMWLDVWLSQDNGVAWDYLGGAGFPDGGDTSSKCGMRIALPNPQNNRRRARVRFRTGRDMNVAVTLELFA